MTELTAEAAVARKNMVDSQVRPNQVSDGRVIAAMRGLAREKFGPPGARVYADADVALGAGRYLLAPMVIARLTQLVLAGDPGTVLVIGAGAGYGAAILAEAGCVVTALESEASLDTGARPAGVTRVNGRLVDGWPQGGPYDAILIEGAVPKIPAALAGQLGASGRLVAILADGNGPAGLGRAVVARPSGHGFAVAQMFDCTARVIPEFMPAPGFVF
jgi:protein-L-isoaspartate(D-aspartate) O-methyltransferase